MSRLSPAALWFEVSRLKELVVVLTKKYYRVCDGFAVLKSRLKEYVHRLNKTSLMPISALPVVKVVNQLLEMVLTPHPRIRSNWP